jgi:hypothetical protein
MCYNPLFPLTISQTIHQATPLTLRSPRCYIPSMDCPPFPLLSPSGKPCVCLFMLFVLLTSKKKQIIKKHCLLGKVIPLTFHILFFFDIYNLFMCELACMSHLLVINQLYFLYFFGLFCLCKQSTCMMGLASTLASTGDGFLYLSGRKYKK